MTLFWVGVCQGGLFSIILGRFVAVWVDVCFNIDIFK